MKGGHKPIHIQKFAPADLHNDEFVQLLERRRDYRTLNFYRCFIDYSFIGGGDLPADPDTLGAVLKMPARDVKAALKLCLGRLIFQAGDRLYQRRVRREVRGEMQFRRGQSEAGKSSAARRWSGRTDAENTRTRAQRLAEARAKGRHTDAQWKALVAFTGGVCLACGMRQEALAGGVLTKDHIVMVSRGGSDGIDNIQPLCRQCNTRSSAGREDYRQKIPGFTAFLASLIAETPNERLTGTPNPPSPLPAPIPIPAPAPAPAPPPAPTGQAGSDPTPNPLVDRDALIREGHALIPAIAHHPDVNLDPTEVLAKASDWNGRGYVRLDTMRDDRLAHTVNALRRWSRQLNGEPEPGMPAAIVSARPGMRESVGDKTVGAIERFIQRGGSK